MTCVKATASAISGQADRGGKNINPLLREF